MSAAEQDGGLRLAVVRHGATALTGAVLNGFGAGAADPDLTEVGAAQAAAAGVMLSDAGFAGAHVLSSPATRARATARIVAAALGGAAVELDERLAEVDFGRWEGRRPADLHKTEPESVRSWWTDPEFTPPQGESAGAAGRRLAGLVDDLLRAPARQNSVVLVGHATSVRALAGVALGGGHGLAMRLTVEPGTVAIVRLWAEGGSCLDMLLQPSSLG
jgi:probable phosphoglycerate mutase